MTAHRPMVENNMAASCQQTRLMVKYKINFLGDGKK